jgi:hypothetical protein
MSKQQFLKENLCPGEIYAGLILGQNGERDYHLVVMAQQPDRKLTWQKAKEWAGSIGGELPTRREQLVLFANAQRAFTNGWYWSGEQHAAYHDYAWGQNFYFGSQNDFRKSYGERARAVRRIYIND